MGTRAESPAAHALMLALLLAMGLLYADVGDPYTVVGIGLVALFVLVDLYYAWYRDGGIRRVARDAWTDWDGVDD